jgi:hypothetical protein
VLPCFKVLKYSKSFKPKHDDSHPSTPGRLVRYTEA